MDNDEKDKDKRDERSYRDRELAERNKRIDKLMAFLELDDGNAASDEAAAVAVGVPSESRVSVKSQNENVAKNIHAGHRQRLRESALRDKNLASFSDVEIIELVLSFMIPRKDTNVLAHRLLDRFGSIIGVITAPPEELAAFSGMTRNAVEFLGMLPLIGQLRQRSAEIEISRGDLMINHISSIGVKKAKRSPCFSTSATDFYPIGE